VAETNLLVVCGTAFIAVFILLIALAVIIRLISVAFPAVRNGDDAVLAAAISTAVAAIYPGARVTKIEEET
jgi:hypothetical protein